MWLCRRINCLYIGLQKVPLQKYFSVVHHCLFFYCPIWVNALWSLLWSFFVICNFFEMIRGSRRNKKTHAAHFYNRSVCVFGVAFLGPKPQGLKLVPVLGTPSCYMLFALGLMRTIDHWTNGKDLKSPTYRSGVRYTRNENHCLVCVFTLNGSCCLIHCILDFYETWFILTMAFAISWLVYWSFIEMDCRIQS